MAGRTEFPAACAALQRESAKQVHARARISAYIAPAKYAQLGQLVFGGHFPDEGRRRLFQGVEHLLDRLNMPRSLKEFGVEEEDFLAALPALAMTAFEDLSNRTNPRMPLVSEITALLRVGYYGDAGLGPSPDRYAPNGNGGSH